MADISVIMEVLGKEDMVKAARLTDQLRNKMKFLGDQLKKEKINYSQYITAVNQLASKNKVLGGGYRALQSSLLSYGNTLLKSNNAVNTAVVANDRLAKSTQALGTAQTVATRKMSSTGVAVQQLGYQAGDFFVQIQSGTNAMVAFGQQATQLVGVLPMVHKQFGLTLGSAVGLSAALGIAIPILTAIGGYFMRTRDSAKEAEDSLDDFTSALNRVNAASDIAGQSIAELREEYGRFAQQVQFASRIVAQAALADSQREYSEVAAGLSESLVGVSDAMAEYARRVEIANTVQRSLGERTLSNASSWDEVDDAVTSARESLVDAASDMGLTAGQAGSLQRILEDLSKAKGPEEIARQASLALEEFDKMFTASTNIPPEIAKAIEALRTMQLEASRATEQMVNLNLASSGMTYGTPLDPTGGLLPPSGDGDGNGGGGRGGGSGTTVDPLLGQIEQLEKFLATERELLLMEYETRQMTLEQSLEKEYLTRQQYADMTLELEGRKNKELSDIELKTQQQKVSIVAGGIQNVLNAAANGNERLLKAARVFGAAEALINSYRAASQALADPTLPFYVKFGAAASVLAAGFGMVNAIKGGGSSKSMSGGLSGGGATSRPSGAEASVPTQSAPQAQRVLIKGLGPKDLLTGEMLQELFDKLYDENQERGAVFMVST